MHTSKADTCRCLPKRIPRQRMIKMVMHCVSTAQVPRHKREAISESAVESRITPTSTSLHGINNFMSERTTCQA